VFPVGYELNSAFCPHSVFMCSVWFSQQTAIMSLKSTNRLGFVMDRDRPTTNSETLNPAARLKLLLLTFVTPSPSHCPYQKGERAKPRNLLTKRCSFFPPPNINASLSSLVTCTFTYSSAIHLSLFYPSLHFKDSRSKWLHLSFS
jgi:hypothetical protein